MGDFPFGPNPALYKQAATPLAGYTLVNGTGTIISWTTPDDGQVHRMMLFTTRVVTVLEVGGAEVITLTAPDGTIGGYTVSGGNAPAGVTSGSTQTFLVQANTVVAFAQSSALTGGAAKVWAEIWGS